MGAKLGGGAFDDINMTPLIDIVLVVLIIMMVNIPIKVEQMGIKLPSQLEVNTPPPEVDVEQLVVAVYEDGSIALNRQLIPEENLRFELGRRLRPMAKKRVFIDAHPDVEYHRVIDMMDIANFSGAETVSMAKLKEDGPRPATGVYQGAIPRGVHPGSPTVVGMINERLAEQQMRPLIPAAMACYEAALAENPTLNGRMIVRVGIGPDGEILETSIPTSNLGKASLEDCIEAQLERLSFEPLGEGNTAAVGYPLLFSPG